MASVDHRNDLVDAALRDEITMVGDLVVAAAESDVHLDQTRIDQILGVEAPAECAETAPRRRRKAKP